MNGQPNLHHFLNPLGAQHLSSQAALAQPGATNTQQAHQQAQQQQQQHQLQQQSYHHLLPTSDHHHHNPFHALQQHHQQQQQQQQQQSRQSSSAAAASSSSSSSASSPSASSLAASSSAAAAYLNELRPQLYMSQEVLQMQAQYEAKIRSLQGENATLRLQLNHCKTGPNHNNTNSSSSSSNNNNNNSTNQVGKFTNSPLSSSLLTTTITKISNNKSQGSSSSGGNVVDTYCEEISAAEYQCRNCPYRARSRAALAIHHTNHGVAQRYLHLPTTVFSVKPRGLESHFTQTFQYPCGECTGKFSHHDLYLHIYQHHAGEHPYHCQECNLFFTYFEFFVEHQRNEHEKTPRSGKKSSTGKLPTASQEPLPDHLTYYSVVKCTKSYHDLANRCSLSSSASASSPSSVMSSGNSSTNNSNHSNTDDSPNQYRLACKRSRGRAARATLAAKPSASGARDGSGLASTGSPSSSSASPSTSSSSLLPTTSIRYACHYEECFFVADCEERLEFHLYAHRSSRFKCPYCPYVSNVLNDIKRHCVRGGQHQGAMFRCTACSYDTNCDKSFREHLRTVHFGKEVDEKRLVQIVEDMFANTTTSNTNNTTNTNATQQQTSGQQRSTS